MSDKTKKCPYCGEEILAIAKKCKYCKSWLEKESSNNHSELSNKSKLDEPRIKEKEEDSDSVWVAIWKIGFIILGVIVLSNLFPNIFSDKLVFTNLLTGEEVTIPIEDSEYLRDYEEPMLMMYDSYMIKYDRAKSNQDVVKFVAHMCTANGGTQKEVDKCVHNRLYKNALINKS